MQIKFFFNFIISVITISLVGSVIFYLITPPNSYIIFILFFILTETIILVIMDNRYSFKIQITESSIILPIFLTVACVTLIILQSINIYIESINTVLYVIVFIITPGFSLINILNFKPKFSRIEFIALVYPVSLAFLTIIGTINLLFPSRAITMIIIITLLSILSLIVMIKKWSKTMMPIELIVKDKEIMLLITLFIIMYFILELYPEITGLLGLDISDNFLQALAFTKEVFENFNINVQYPLFHIFLSYIIYIIKPSIETFHCLTIFLNIITILAFYCMSHQYLERYSEYAPMIATLIWTTFAGFGWFYFFTQKIYSPNNSFFSLIAQADAFSYGDITWRRLFFYLSMEVSLTLVFTILYLLKRNDISKRKHIFLITILITPLPLMHSYASYFLLSLLLCFIIFSSKELKEILKLVAYSLLIASFTSLLLNYILNINISNIPINFLIHFEYLIVSIILFTIITLQNSPLRNFIVIHNNIFNVKYIANIFVVILMLLYTSSLLLWFRYGFTFNFIDLNYFGYVPWLLYPIKLGITGILAIIVIYLLLRDNKYISIEIWAFLTSVLLMVFTSRVISTIQMQCASGFTFDPNSWVSESIRKIIFNFREERMFELYKIPLAIISSIFFSTNILTKTKIKNLNLLNCLKVSGLISLILITGISSTFLGFEYYKNHAEINQISPIELDLINFLRNKIYANGKSIIIGKQTPFSYLDFTGATTLMTELKAAWASNSPELPLFITRYSKTTPTYIYLNKIRDYQKNTYYTDNYLEYIGSTSQIYLENQEVQVKIINNISIPTPQSSTALIIPYNVSTTSILKPIQQGAYRQSTILATEAVFYAYELLSSVGLNYTTVLSNDNMIDNYETLILPYDDKITQVMLDNIEAKQNTTKTRYIIILNTNGYGPLLDFFGNMSSETFTANGILTDKLLALEPQIEVPLINPNNHTKIKAQYVNKLFSSPLIMTIIKNKLTLIYLNINPLITENQFLTQALIQSMIDTLSEYIHLFNEIKTSLWFNEPSMLFEKINAIGNISITSKSIISNLTNTNNSSITQINATKITIQGGYGFYTSLIAHNPTIIMQGNKTFTKKINGNVNFIIRQPEISVNGEIQLNDFYMLHPQTIRTDGRATSLRGNIILHIYASDEFSIVLPYQFNSPITVSYEQPYMQFNETYYLFTLIPYILIVGIILSPSLIFYNNVRTNED